MVSKLTEFLSLPGPEAYCAHAMWTAPGHRLFRHWNAVNNLHNHRMNCGDYTKVWHAPVPAMNGKSANQQPVIP